jgi:hypothetical protein
MQSDAPQSDPRLQRVTPGHATVAIRCGEPCIAYLETTLSGEIPLLGACWANNSLEVRKPGQPAYVVLQGVTVIQNQPNHKRLWTFSQERSLSVYLIFSPSHRQLAKLSYSPTSFESAPQPVFRWAVRHLDHETHLSIRRVRTDFPNDLKALTAAIFRLANLDWLSIADALAFIERAEIRTKPARRRSLIHRVVSSVFKKKQKPVHA